MWRRALYRRSGGTGVASLIALTLALACAVIPLMPRQYSATALVYPNLFSGEQGKLILMGTIDAASLVSSEARLIVSDGILQAVVKRLDLNPGTAGPGCRRVWTGFGPCFFRKPVTIRATKWRL